MRSAIIDIGYNAIRAVVYDNDTLGAPEVFNNKFKSDLLHLLDSNDLNSKHQFYLVLQHLNHIFEQLGVKNIKCVATEILRGHPKAQEFQKIALERFNIDIEILSGEREAYLTASGLISGIQSAEGVVADLGGGSLELAEISNKTVGTLKSLPLGTKVIQSNKMADFKLISDQLKQEFSTNSCDSLYLIGGAFRIIGRFYMEFINYPINNLHNLSTPKAEFEMYLGNAEHMFISNPGYRHKLINYNAILVAKALIFNLSPKQIVISNYGLKEGVRFLALSETERNKDIVYERVTSLVGIDNPEHRYKAYNELISNLLVTPDSITKGILELSLMLAQFNKNIDKTLRTDFSIEFVLDSDIPFSHKQRVMIALALSISYNTHPSMHISKVAKRIISKLDYYNSIIIGHFIRIAREVEGPEFSSPSFGLSVSHNYIEIKTKSVLPKFIFQKIHEYLKAISNARKSAHLL